MHPGARARKPDACVALYLLAVSAAACGGAQTDRGAGGVHGVEAAALPYRVLRARGGQEIAPDRFLAELGQAAAVCIGEQHSNPHDHWAQLHLIDHMTAASRAAGVQMAVGMEMFQRPFQGVLDDFAAGRIDEAALLSRAGWKERWGFDWSLYRPLVLMARERGAALLALNVPRELTRKVAREGVAALGPADRALLPQLVLDDADHRAWWQAIMATMDEGHGHSLGDSSEGSEGGEGEGEAGEGEAGEGEAGAKKKSEADQAEEKAAAERMYTAQVLWDESMADVASTWLRVGAGEGGSARKGRRQVIILAGSGHCHESAVVRRIERRGAGSAVSVHPIIDDGKGNVAELLAAPENDYLFVMSRRLR